MLHLENKFWSQGYRRVLGMDEVGRGALAGPVTVGGVIWRVSLSFQWREGVTDGGIRDSKALTPPARERLARFIMAEAEAYAISSRDQSHIDEFGIVHAVQSCQHEIVAKLAPDVLLLDAFALPNCNPTIVQQAIVRGDQLSLSIAAASIIAKVARDRYMCELDPQYLSLIHI